MPNEESAPGTAPPPERRVAAIAVFVGSLGVVGAIFTGFLALFLVYGLSGSTVGLHDSSDWRAYLLMLAGTAVLLAIGPLVMFIGRRSMRWLIAAIGIVVLVLAIGLVIGFTAG